MVKGMFELLRSQAASLPALAKFALVMAVVFAIPPLARRVRFPGVVGLLLTRRSPTRRSLRAGHCDLPQRLADRAPGAWARCDRELWRRGEDSLNWTLELTL